MISEEDKQKEIDKFNDKKRLFLDTCIILDEIQEFIIKIYNNNYISDDIKILKDKIKEKVMNYCRKYILHVVRLADDVANYQVCFIDAIEKIFN